MKFFSKEKYLIGIAIAAVAVLLIASIIVWKTTFEQEKNEAVSQSSVNTNLLADTLPADEPPLFVVPVSRQVTVGQFFKYVDSLVGQYDTLTPYQLTEHLLVRANPWIIDTLENTDYYRQTERGNFVFDQRKMTVLRPGDTLRLPGEKTAAALLANMASARLEINIPSFQLRIVEGDSALYTFLVRVGKNQKKFLALAGNEVDLRTQTGTGEIVRVSRDPIFLDPVTGEKFEFTKRDDHKTTRMPLIPWIEPAINGIRYGQMIHPTTNPKTLGKPASNGCIGVREADAWRIYYHAPVGTKVIIRYDVVEINEKGDTLRFDDIYRYQTGKKKAAAQASLFPLPKMANVCWCEP